MAAYQHLLEPIRIGSMKVKNRFVMPAMLTNYCGSDGSVTDQFLAYHKARAKGGVGLIITEDAYVHPCGKGFPSTLGIYTDELIPGLKKLTAAIHAEDAKIAVQLYHAGRQTVSAVTGMHVMAPSPLACTFCGEMPHEMTKDDIRQTVEAFGKAARRACDASFDAVDIHGAHGYLLNQFLSPFSNKRTDEYGGSAENRQRFPLEVLKSVREHVASDFPVLFRLSSEEFVTGGLTLEDQMAFAGKLVDKGVDAIHVSGGIYASIPMIIPPAALQQGLYVNNAAAIRKAIAGKVPIIVAGRLKDPDMMESVIADGKADMVSIGRGLLADEAFPAKVAAGRASDIRKCIACNQGCCDRLLAHLPIGCLGNALTGRESQYDLCKKALTKKKVLVAGGGPGGMEAARIAALRGHDVHLYEKNVSLLGGLMRYVVLAPFKAEFGDLLNFQVNRLEKSGVTVKLGQAVDATIIDRLKPDVVIVATGARPIRPAIPGLDRLPVKLAEEILAGAPCGKNVVIIGGGAVGYETAEFLLDRGTKTTVIEILDEVARDVGALEKMLLLQRLMEKGAQFMTKTIVRRITSEGKIVLEKDCKQEALTGIDTVVLAVGYESVTELTQVLTDKNVPFIAIGDCVKPRNILNAVWDGFLTAYDL